MPYLRGQGLEVISSDVHMRGYDNYVRADTTLFARAREVIRRVVESRRKKRLFKQA